MNNKFDYVKILGFAATVIGFGAQLLSDWTAEKEMDAKIEEKVNEKLAEKDKES